MSAIRYHGEMYDIDGEKAEAIVAACGQRRTYVLAYLLDDWCWHGEDHQVWLDTAPVEEIVEVTRPGVADAHLDDDEDGAG
jgi:hypothetical protein